VINFNECISLKTWPCSRIVKLKNSLARIEQYLGRSWQWLMISICCVHRVFKWLILHHYLNLKKVLMTLYQIMFVVVYMTSTFLVLLLGSNSIEKSLKVDFKWNLSSSCNYKAELHKKFGNLLLVAKQCCGSSTFPLYFRVTLHRHHHCKYIYSAPITNYELWVKTYVHHKIALVCILKHIESEKID